MYSLCVPGKQLVNAVSGAKKACEVEVGDQLWTLDRGFLAKTTVSGISSHKTHDVVRVQTLEGSIKLTADHPVKTSRGWCEAGSLLAGDLVEWFPPRKLCRETPVAVPGYDLGYLLGAVASEGSIQDRATGLDSGKRPGLRREDSRSLAGGFFHRRAYREHTGGFRLSGAQDPDAQGTRCL